MPQPALMDLAGWPAHSATIPDIGLHASDGSFCFGHLNWRTVRRGPMGLKYSIHARQCCFLV